MDALGVVVGSPFLRITVFGNERYKRCSTWDCWAYAGVLHVLSTTCPSPILRLPRCWYLPIMTLRHTPHFLPLFESITVNLSRYLKRSDPARGVLDFRVEPMQLRREYASSPKDTVLSTIVDSIPKSPDHLPHRCRTAMAVDALRIVAGTAV